jgi:hypothetical protein
MQLADAPDGFAAPPAMSHLPSQPSPPPQPSPLPKSANAARSLPQLMSGLNVGVLFF